MQEKIKNIHVLATDKPSRVRIGNNGNFVIGLSQNATVSKNDSYTNHNIYITSDEPAYTYALHLKNQKVLKINAVGENSGELYHDKGFSYPEECKKIILTTDQDLIKDGVQAIDNEFLEWFVKNPSCDEVETVFNNRGITGAEKILKTFGEYKIIIPKEEPKQETLEEASERILLGEDLDLSDYDKRHIFKAMVNIAKWQQERMYSEEEVYDILIHHTVELFKKEPTTLEDFWNKFKKK